MVVVWLMFCDSGETPSCVRGLILTKAKKCVCKCDTPKFGFWSSCEEVCDSLIYNISRCFRWKGMKWLSDLLLRFTEPLIQLRLINWILFPSNINMGTVSLSPFSCQPKWPPCKKTKKLKALKHCIYSAFSAMFTNTLLKWLLYQQIMTIFEFVRLHKVISQSGKNCTCIIKWGTCLHFSSFPYMK